MLSKFSWQQYWCFIAVATAFYYAGVVFLFYRHEILSLITGRRNTPVSSKDTGKYYPPKQRSEEQKTIASEEAEEAFQNESGEETGNPEAEETPEEADDEDEQKDEAYNERMQQLIEKISDAVSVVLSAHTEDSNKEELLQNIGHAIAGITDYEEIKKIREALDWFMERQASLICGLVLTPKDLRQVWEIVQS